MLPGRRPAQLGDLDPDRHVHQRAAGEGGPAFLDPRPPEGRQVHFDGEPHEPDVAAAAGGGRRALDRARHADRRAPADQAVRARLQTTDHDCGKQKTSGTL